MTAAPVTTAPTTTTPTTTTPTTTTESDPDGAAAARGSLTIADGVVEKVAAAAAGEIEHVGGTARRVMGVPTGREDGDGTPRVTARVSGEAATLDVRLSITYPASVRTVTEAVRTHVRDRVQTLTELDVTRIDISVAALTTVGAGSTKRVVE